MKVNGWTVTYYPARMPGAQWVATKRGVTLTAVSQRALTQKIAEQESTWVRIQSSHFVAH